MVAALDYSFFPHIFSEIISQCDFATQNKLRLLCSSAKTDIDKHQCHSIQICICPKEYMYDEFDRPPGPHGPQTQPPDAFLSVSSEVRTSEGRTDMREAPVQFATNSVPDEQARPMTDAIHPASMFALRHARSVTTWTESLMWDHTYASRAKEDGTSYNSPYKFVNAPRMNLYVDDFLFLGGEFLGPYLVPVPPSVCNLFVHFCDMGPGDGSQLVHNCTTVTVRLEPCYPLVEEDISYLMIKLLTPVVRLLTIIVDDTTDAAAYLNVIKERERNPELTIVVETTSKTGPYDADGLQVKFTKLFGAEVIVRQQ